ncbi:MAG: DUF3570 domain-containing protein [Polyangiaceae bacterium]
MQLSRSGASVRSIASRVSLGGVACALVSAATFFLGERAALAQAVDFSTAHTLYHEAPTGSNMTVYTPSVDLAARPASWIDVRGGYEADIVSGASVAVKAGPAYQASNPGADVVTSASVKDVRHRGQWGLSLRKGDVQWNGGFSYSTENDYKSRTLSTGIRTDAYEHNTQFELSYARSFDSVCDRVQSTSDSFGRFRALENSNGCFTSDPLRRLRGLDVDGLQGSWTQAWTPVFSTQVVYSAQILNGFQSNPYRSVVLGQGIKAEEHHPEDRARHAVAARANLYLKPLKTALRFGVRGYIDSWDVKSTTGELEAERYFGEAFRVALRGRFYLQSRALFWSDDYTGGDPPLGPKGQYFSGDRELSHFLSYMVGARIAYGKERKEERLLGFLHAFRVGGAFDVVHFEYFDYTLGGKPVNNARAYIGTAYATLVF